MSCSSSKDTAVKNESSPKQRYLILTADDFGASKNINEGIKYAADNNGITTISVLSNFSESLPDLHEIAQNHPEIGIGVHLNIVTGKPLLGVNGVPSLVSDSGDFYTIEKLLPNIKSISLDELRKELRAQIHVLIDYGIRLDHLSDQNVILSFYGPFFEILTDLALEFDVPVRSPLLAGVKYPRVFTNSNMKKRYRHLAFKCVIASPSAAVALMKNSKVDMMEEKVQKLEELEIGHPDILVESFWGEPTASNLIHILENLPEGTSEIILHFGTFTHPDNIPSGLERDYFNHRENELITVTSDYLKEYYNHLKIKTIGYSDIAAEENNVGYNF